MSFNTRTIDPFFIKTAVRPRKPKNLTTFVLRQMAISARMRARCNQLLSSVKQHMSVFVEHFFMMLGIGLALLLTLKILTWMF